MKYLLAILAGVGAWFAVGWFNETFVALSWDGHISDDAIRWVISVGAGLLVIAQD